MPSYCECTCVLVRRVQLFQVHTCLHQPSSAPTVTKLSAQSIPMCSKPIAKSTQNGTSVSPGSDTRRTERAQHAASHQRATTLQQKETSVHCNYSSNCCNSVTMSVAHHGSPVVVCTVSRTACTLCTMAQGSCPVPLLATAAAASVATRKLSRNSHNSGR